MTFLAKLNIMILFSIVRDLSFVRTCHSCFQLSGFKDASPIRNINQFTQLYDLLSSLSPLGSVIKVGSHFGAWNQNSQ